MSAEGDDNLDNDAAGELISVTSELLWNRVLMLMKHPNGHEYDDQEIGELFFTIEMIFALMQNRMLEGVPSSANVLKEISPFIARWKEYHILAGHEPPQLRLRTMTETFERLSNIIQELGPCEPLDEVPPNQPVIRGYFAYSDSQGNPRPKQDAEQGDAP